MSFPIHHLPIVQNWDCHTRGTCCKEYIVEISDAERQRLEAQRWDRDKDLGGLAPYRTTGWFRRHYHLNHQPDGSCVFLSEQGRCRIHEKHGYEAKPLPCKMFPFVLIPQGDRWGVSVRYACPSAVENLGPAMQSRTTELAQFAGELAERVDLKPGADGLMNPPPRLQGGQRVEWPELRRFVATLMRLLADRTTPFERRMRRCLTFVEQCRQASRLHEQTGETLGELLDILADYTEKETIAELAAVPSPTWIGRVLFRQLLAIFSRKDHGPNKGPAMRSRWSLLRAAWRFARGTGRVPRLHRWIPECTFAEVEDGSLGMTAEAEALLERYYLMKTGSLQFCGAACFGLYLWPGFEALALTLPIVLWIARTFRPLPAEEGIKKALSIVDDHYGFNPVLNTIRQKFGMRLLSRRGETARLIARYAL